MTGYGNRKNPQMMARGFKGVILVLALKVKTQNPGLGPR